MSYFLKIIRFLCFPFQKMLGFLAVLFFGKLFFLETLIFSLNCLLTGELAALVAMIVRGTQGTVCECPTVQPYCIPEINQVLKCFHRQIHLRVAFWDGLLRMKGVLQMQHGMQ